MSENAIKGCAVIPLLNIRSSEKQLRNICLMISLRKWLAAELGVITKTCRMSPAEQSGNTSEVRMAERIEAHRNKLRHKRRGKRKVRIGITDKCMIDKRPLHIKDRKRIGDCEGDFIASGKGGEGLLFVCADRKSRAPFLEKIYPVSIRCVENAIGRIQKRFPELQTLTFDNDILFIHHKALERKFHIKVYFCHSHSPWEKPLVENRNKIIRLYIPKGSDISQYSRKYIQKLEDKLQRRIMKCLNYKLPKEILAEHRKRKKKR